MTSTEWLDKKEKRKKFDGRELDEFPEDEKRVRKIKKPCKRKRLIRENSSDSEDLTEDVHVNRDEDVCEDVQKRPPLQSKLFNLNMQCKSPRRKGKKINQKENNKLNLLQTKRSKLRVT